MLDCTVHKIPIWLVIIARRVIQFVLGSLSLDNVVDDAVAGAAGCKLTDAIAEKKTNTP